MNILCNLQQLIEVAKYDAQLDKHENFSAEELVSGDFRRKPLGVFAYKHDVAVLTIRDYPPVSWTSFECDSFQWTGSLNPFEI